MPAVTAKALVREMVVEAAFRAEADTLYTEDLSRGQRFGTLTVTNPFLA